MQMQKRNKFQICTGFGQLIRYRLYLILYFHRNRYGNKQAFHAYFSSPKSSVSSYLCSGSSSCSSSSLAETVAYFLFSGLSTFLTTSAKPTLGKTLVILILT